MVANIEKKKAILEVTNRKYTIFFPFLQGKKTKT